MPKVMVATTPFGMVVALRPQATQVEFPALLLHEMDLTAVVAAVPADTDMDEKSDFE